MGAFHAFDIHTERQETDPSIHPCYYSLSESVPTNAGGTFEYPLKLQDIG